MEKICRQCSAPFEITKDDLSFLEKVSPLFDGKKEMIPPPTLCPDCRFLSRMSFRNEWSLYHQKCALTGKQIISLYAPESPFVVYDQDVWWSDAYDPLSYGRPFDFSKSFFEQFGALHRAVPKAAIHNAKSENCAYTNYSAENKNCYMVVGGLGCEDCYYSYRLFFASHCIDCHDLIRCQRCHECLESNTLFSCTHCRNCQNSSDLHWCQDCSGCQDCYGCANLRNKRFHIYNTAFSEEEYRRKIAAIGMVPSLEARQDIQRLWLKVPHRFAQNIQCEDSTGDQLLECRHCTDCYTLKNSQDCRLVAVASGNRDVVDANFCDNCELQYYSANLEKNYQTIFSSLLWYTKECAYTANSFNSHHLFGCSGMKKHSFCILNQQYSAEEYTTLVPKIIDHMRKNGEWGEYFPPSLSPFGYNETVAYEFHPLPKEEVLKRGWRWTEEVTEGKTYLGPAIAVPEKIEDVSDALCSQILTCEVTGKPYRIIPQELKFYREMKLPVPRLSPAARHRNRMSRMNPRRLWKRECMKCKKGIETTYSPERPEIVCCEECYLASVY